MITHVTCPNCGGIVEINTSTKKCFCLYCDSEFLVFKKPNEQFKEIKELCFRFSLQDTTLSTAASEYIKETRLYLSAQKMLGLPPEDEVFLICTLSFWTPCKKGFAICENGLYFRGDKMEKSRHLTWEEFKHISIQANDTFMIDNICFSTDEKLTFPLKDLFEKIQQMI